MAAFNDGSFDTGAFDAGAFSFGTQPITVTVESGLSVCGEIAKGQGVQASMSTSFSVCGKMNSDGQSVCGEINTGGSVKQ